MENILNHYVALKSAVEDGVATGDIDVSLLINLMNNRKELFTNPLFYVDYLKKYEVEPEETKHLEEWSRISHVQIHEKIQRNFAQNKIDAYITPVIQEKIQCRMFIEAVKNLFAPPAAARCATQ
jgi:hypothetical protein